MARIPSVNVALFFFLAALISHVLTLPLLQRDDVDQFKADLELFTGDLTSLDQAIEAETAGPQPTISQGEDFTSAFSTTTGDLQTCIQAIKSIDSIDEADAEIVLKLATNFTPKITGVLGSLRNKYYTFRRRGMVTTVLNQVRTLDSGVTQLMGNLKNVVP
ncbi:hypothetical protein AX14_009937, partial [Amanita brunnescens Koide BX004]